MQQVQAQVPAQVQAPTPVQALVPAGVEVLHLLQLGCCSEQGILLDRNHPISPALLPQ